MSTLTAKQHGRIGVSHLRFAVLEVLYQAKIDGKQLNWAAISEESDIFRKPGSTGGTSAIAWGVLNSLELDNFTVQTKLPPRGSYWEITEEVFNKRGEEGIEYFEKISGVK